MMSAAIELQKLEAQLLRTLSPHREEREIAERQLAQHEGAQSVFVAMLLQLIDMPSAAPAQAKLVAAVLVKNTLRRHRSTALPDLANIASRLPISLLRSSLPLVQAQLAEALRWLLGAAAVHSDNGTIAQLLLRPLADAVAPPLCVDDAGVMMRA